MAKHWAEDFYGEYALAPQPGDEAVFLSILLMGEEALCEQYPGSETHFNFTMRVRSSVDKFCAAHHPQGTAASTGAWVRYEIWRDRHRATQVAAHEALPNT